MTRIGNSDLEVFPLALGNCDDPSVPVGEIITALDALVREGKVRAIGASNISPERLAASLDFSEREGLARYEILQARYNLVEREEFEGPLADLAAARGLSTAPYYALARGFLTGKYRSGGQRVDSPRARQAGVHLRDGRGPKVLAALDEVAAAHGAEVATVALAWLAARPTVVAPIASASAVEQVAALTAAA